MTDLTTLSDAAVDYLTAVAMGKEPVFGSFSGSTRVPSLHQDRTVAFRPTAGGSDGAEVLGWLWGRDFSMALVAEVDGTASTYYKGSYREGEHSAFDLVLATAARINAATPWRALCLATIAHALHTGTLTDAQVAEAVRLAGGEG